MLFCYLDPVLGPGQGADAGMYLQTVILLLRAEGLRRCPQVMMWTMYWRTVSEVVGADGLVLLCGVAVGHEDETAPPSRTTRASLAETVSFVGM